MRQFFKKALAVVLTGVLLAGASISAAAAPQELSVTPTVASGEAAVEGDVITLTEGKAATVAFQPSQELDIIEYQYSLAQPADTNETIVDVTDWETADSLVPAYSFSGLKEGTYQITLTLTENANYGKKITGPDELVFHFSDEQTGQILYAQELADAVQESLQSLPENLREAMIDAFWYDKPVDAKLRTAALKALRTPTVCQTLRTYV